MKLFLVLITTIISSCLSSMSGSGTGIINFPIFLSLGIPIPLILSMGSVNGAFWVLPASRNYLKGRKIDWKFLILFSLIGLVGTYFSVKVALNASQRTFEIFVGTIILILVTYTYFKKGLGLTERKVYSQARQALAYPFALLIGFYENFFGSGNAIAFSLVGYYTKGFDFIDSLGHYYAACFPWLVFGSYLFIRKGFFDFWLMSFGIIGSIIGSYIGSKYARYKGNKFIKLLLVIIGGVLGLKLLLGL